jgi:hypothetical protein
MYKKIEEKTIDNKSLLCISRTYQWNLVNKKLTNKVYDKYLNYL